MTHRRSNAGGAGRDAALVWRIVAADAARLGVRGENSSTTALRQISTNRLPR